ncbi:MAG: tetratricopeptide repeat protein [Alphaproteobacteria bacterium]|nr:tetratricopeptide repeat protein [Alphaproteobacteria bacterium]
MLHRDHRGLAVSGADAAAIEGYETALRQFQCYVDDPVATIDGTLERSPAFVMGHVLRAYLFLLGTEPSGLAPARDSYAAARRHPANEREAGHLDAIGQILDGNWVAAGRSLEDVAIAHPRDTLALQAGHIIDFLLGDSRMLRDRIARALPAWSRDMPGWHAVLGMHAFGLEETGLYDRAEETGRAAIAIEPRDGWAQHAVAHVLEMRCRPGDGIAWMRGNEEGWSRDSFFSVHNWWHLALFHLELGEVDEALALYDDPAKIKGGRSGVVLDMIDASAFLWRLHLRGVDVADRWRPIAEQWAPIARAGNYAFNDAHAVMAFAGAGRHDLVEAVLTAQDDAMRGAGDNARFIREVGRPVTLGIAAFAAGDHAAALRLLRPVRNGAARFGGSHAQRDLIDLTMIEAALRDREEALAAALVAERASLRPDSPFTRLLQHRASALPAAA